MGYQSYDPYEYDPYQQGDHQQPDGYQHGDYQQGGYQQEGGYQQPYSEGGYAEQGQYGSSDQYTESAQYAQADQYAQAEQYAQADQYAQQSQYQDAQWAQSGLGWERQAWDETRLGVSPLQELDYPPSGFDGGQYGQTEYDERRYDESQYGERPRNEPQHEHYEQYDQYDQYNKYGEFGAYPAPPPAGNQDSYDPLSELPHPRERHEAAAEPVSSAASSTPASASADAEPAAIGRGAFGAAGIGVVAAICALASAGALVVAIALIQAGIAYGWQQAITRRENGRPDRRAVVLTALVGWAAAASAFRLPKADDFVGLPVTLGVGFLLLAADQTLRSRPLGDGERVAGLDLAVTGGLFAVLPAGFVVAERSDTALTAACALAAAVGVLCCALLGRNPLRGIFVALVLGAGVGAVTAQSLAADGGLKAGALGGAVAALGAAAALGAMDRISVEGGLRGSTRVVTQVLPLSLAAMGALFASAVFR